MNDTPAEREDISIWAKLRRRRVAQWGLAYAAGAWVLLQVLGFVTDSFAWPATVKQIATIVLAVGLPIVVVLGWYHGERGQRRVSGPELAVLTLLLLLGGGLLWLYAHRTVPTTTAATAAKSPPTSVATDARPSVAVLPFENRSDESKDAFFVDGIHDDILTQLSKVSALRVISRTSVEQFRDTKLPMKAIADQLGVSKILEGGVQRAGERVRVTVQLIDAATDAHLWAENYDRELSAANIFAIQSEVAGAIAAALKASLTPAERTSVSAMPTESLEAWEAYQLGKQRLAKRTKPALVGAQNSFRSAIARDPNFALAWIGLADTLTVLTTYGEGPQDAGLEEAEKALDRALELDPNLAEAWASSGLVAVQRLQFDRAEQMFRRAIAFNPNYAPAHHWLSGALSDLGRRDEALTEAERAVTLDPLSAVINVAVGRARSNVGRFDEALLAFQQAIEIDPTNPRAYGNIGDLYAYGYGRLDTAIPWYERAADLDPGSADLPGWIALAYWQLGDAFQANQWLTRSLSIGEGTFAANFVAAVAFLEGGKDDAARRHAQRAADLDPWGLYLIRDDDLRKGDYAKARMRYADAFPHLFAKNLSEFSDRDAFAAIDLALVLQHTGEGELAQLLLDRSETYFRNVPLMGAAGSAIARVAIHALRGETAKSLAKLREAEKAGWRDQWRYYRDFDPNLASIRNEPEFKAVFADIERDMAKQRAALAARPKDAPLELAETGT